jgi:hypothetical protein
MSVSSGRKVRSSFARRVDIHAFEPFGFENFVGSFQFLDQLHGNHSWENYTLDLMAGLLSKGVIILTFYPKSDRLISRTNYQNALKVSCLKVQALV